MNQLYARVAVYCASHGVHIPQKPKFIGNDNIVLSENGKTLDVLKWEYSIPRPTKAQLEAISEQELTNFRRLSQLARTVEATVLTQLSNIDIADLKTVLREGVYLIFNVDTQQLQTLVIDEE